MCAESEHSTDFGRYSCLERLARLDRAFAANLLQSAQEQWREIEDPRLQELARSLASYSSSQALYQRFMTLGLVNGSVHWTADHAEARSLLRAAGRLIGFEAETRRRPMGHDSKLRRLAARAGGPLANVVFEEALVDTAQPPHYQIRAYFGGLRSSADLNLSDDCYDLKAMVGLLNSTARSLNVETRFVPLATNDEGAWVVIGPEAALREVVAEGLLCPGSGVHSHAPTHHDH